MPLPRRRGGRVCSTDALFISQVLVLATLLAVCPEIFKRSNRFLVDRNSQAPYTLNQFQRHFSLVAAVYFAVLAPIHLVAGYLAPRGLNLRLQYRPSSRSMLHPSYSVSSPTSSPFRCDNNFIVALMTFVLAPQVIRFPTYDP